MANKTVDVYDKSKIDKHRLETYLAVIKGYLQGVASVCDVIESKPELFPTWNSVVTEYITAALNVVLEMESRYGRK